MRTYIRDGRAPIPLNEKTSQVMSSIQAKNTKPELIVRKVLSSAGVRGYRLHSKNVPGRPDITFPKKKIAIFVQGCFWHGCRYCKLKLPKTHRDFWQKKFARNRLCDKRNTARLKKLGWRVYQVWEHDVKVGRLSPLLTWLKREVRRKLV